jgi:hypothetical protein
MAFDTAPSALGHLVLGECGKEAGRRPPLALNLAPCFTPVESPESNGTAEALV